MQYPADLRDVVVRRILAHEISARDAVDEYGVAHSTVYHWVSRARKQAASHDDAALTPSGMMMPQMTGNALFLNFKRSSPEPNGPRE